MSPHHLQAHFLFSQGLSHCHAWSPKALGGEAGEEGEGDFFGEILPASPALAEVVSPEKQGSINKHGIPWEAGWEGSPASPVPLTEMAH